MTLYVDQPIWPWRGRRWAHLISDRSVAELHAAARDLQIPERAFDGDHYDVPEEQWRDIVAYGAIAVSSREIVRLLKSSGLWRPRRNQQRGD